MARNHKLKTLNQNVSPVVAFVVLLILFIITVVLVQKMQLMGTLLGIN